MDAVLTTLIGAAPQLTGAGLLLVLLGLLLRREAADRVDYRAGLADLTTRHATELARINTDHDAELGELRKELAAVRGQLNDLNAKLDAERDRRRAAEDARRSPQNPALGQLQGEPPWAE